MNRFSFNSQLRGSFVVVLVVFCLPAHQLSAQLVQQAVGGVAVDANGVVAAPTREDTQRLQKILETAVGQPPQDLQTWSDLRAVSLKRIEAALAEHQQANKPLTEAVRYLAGLQRVKYVLVYPEQNDVVLAGPAEGWRADALGNVVGTTTNRPVLLLDDLIVAMRTRETAQLEPISCSIDPTSSGMQQYRALMRRQRTIGNPQETLRRMEKALGPQMVSVTGVPVSSHFARTLVAADFRMKRIAMNFQPAPIDGLPSFLQVLKSSRGKSNQTPRWWLAAKYDPLLRDAEGLAWELRGQGVQCLTEQDHFNSEGERERTVQGSAAATRWAQTFTECFSDLADHDSAFGQLRNAMDLAVVAALIDQEGLLNKAGLDLPRLIHEQEIARYHAPIKVASQATFVRRRGDYVISTSGGVQVLPWEVVAKTEQSTELAKVRLEHIAGGENWYWD